MLVPPQLASLVLLLLLTAAAAVTDYRTGLIPNRLLTLALAASLLLRVVVEPLALGVDVRWAALTWALGMATCTIVPLILYLSRGMAGGDVKLFAVCGALLGPWASGELVAYAFACGSLFALGYLAHRGVLFRTLASAAGQLVPARLSRASTPKDGLLTEPFRFGPAIFAGALLLSLQHTLS